MTKQLLTIPLGRILISFIAALSIGCSSTTTQQVYHPPRLELAGRGTVGLIEFSDNAAPSVGEYLTQEFETALYAAQADIPILNLGKLGAVLHEVGEPELNFRAIQKIGQRYNADSIVHGNMVYSDIETDFDLKQIHQLKARVKQTLRAKLSISFHDTESGAKFYSNSVGWNRKLSNIQLDAQGNIRVNDDGRKNAYEKLVPDMVHDVTRDLRGTYTTRRVPK